MGTYPHSFVFPIILDGAECKHLVGFLRQKGLPVKETFQRESGTGVTIIGKDIKDLSRTRRQAELRMLQSSVRDALHEFASGLDHD